ncbi:MAG: hypothetical protein AAGA31_03910 [Bacteroidota bacterium]
MKKLLLFAGLLLTTFPLLSQNIGTDMQRILRLAPAARAQESPTDNPALDTIVLTLAYYGGMPEVEQIEALFSGPALLAHYRKNPAIREFLLGEKLDQLLESYLPPADLALPDYLATKQRASFLQHLAGDELFSREGKVDLGKIRQEFTAPPAPAPSLKAAAAGAANQPAGLSTANLVGNALNGLSDWISRRAQEELTYTFLTKLREDLRRNDLNHLFPRTANFLPQLDLLNYKAILPSIRKAFTEDLNAVAYNLGNYLEARDAASFRDPVVYNVFLIYRILDLEMREVPLADILAFTYGELERARIDTRKIIDLRIAEVDTTNAEYQHILTAFDNYIKAQDQLNNRFQAAEDLLSEQFFNPILTQVEEGEFSEDKFEAFIIRADEVFSPADAAKLPLKNNYWETKPNPPATGIVRSWLRGEEAYAYYEAYPSLTRFDELFGPDAPAFDPQERRAAGLTAVREILAQREDLEAYEAQLDRLVNAREDLIQLRKEVANQQAEDALAKTPLKERKATLLSDLDAEYDHDPHPALRLLRKVTEEILIDQPSAKKQLIATEKRLADWVAERGSSTSPYAKKREQGPIAASNLPPLQPAINSMREAYDQLHEAVQSYSSSQADSLVRAYHNLTTFESIFGMAQQSFFLLADSDSDLFLDNSKMAVFQTNASARQLLSGISQERIGRVPNIGRLNTSGLTDFLLDFGLYLSEYRDGHLDKDLKGLSRQTVRRVQAVDFITQTLQSLLNAPILQSISEEGEALSLAQEYPAFAKVPEVSAELNELFRLSQTKEYRYAVDNLLNLLRLFEIVPTASKKEERLLRRRDELRNLMADYVVEKDADLQAIGLAVPSADRIPLVGDDKANARVLAYSSQLQTETDPYGREELTNSIRDLKINNIRHELQEVENKISKLNPQKINRFRENLFRYGTFMADVANADNPGEFEAALNSVALPPGSSQIKRNRPSSFELGAYFGAALSRERLVLPAGVDVPVLEEEVFGASLFVPVGVSYSKNIGGNKSITLFGSLIDLGALTAFRLESNSDAPGAPRVERLPEFRPANVIAPGFHVMYNFPKSPLTLGFGVQDGPSVRKFVTGTTIGNGNGNVEREARSIRAMLTFSVDVPIFRFFNK